MYFFLIIVLILYPKFLACFRFSTNSTLKCSINDQLINVGVQLIFTWLFIYWIAAYIKWNVQLETLLFFTNYWACIVAGSKAQSAQACEGYFAA